MSDDLTEFMRVAKKIISNGTSDEGLGHRNKLKIKKSFTQKISGKNMKKRATRQKAV